MAETFKAPSGAKVNRKDELVGAPPIPTRFIGRPGSPWAGADLRVTFLGVDEGAVQFAYQGVQYKVGSADGYFSEAEGVLPGGVPTAEHWPGATGETDQKRPSDHLYGLGPGQEGGVQAAEEGEPGEFAGTLPLVRPDLQGQPPDKRHLPGPYQESTNVTAKERVKV